MQYKQAGEWLEGRGDEDVRVMSREPSTAFYAGGDLVELPYATPEETIDYGRSHGADYLVLSRSLVETLRPQLTELLDTGGRIIPGVEEVYHSGEGTDGELVIFRISG